MSARKKKALASELIDDLLNDDDMQGTKVQSKSKKTKKKKTRSTVSSDGPADLHDKTKILENEEPEVKKPEVSSDLVDRSSPHDATNVVMATNIQAAPRSSGQSSSSIADEVNLRSANNLHLAQQKILELEAELQRLRAENEELVAAGDALRKRVDELTAHSEKSQRDQSDAKEIFNQERNILQATIEARDRSLVEVKMKNEELESRISTSVQKIRVRERELENRLELLKMESVALTRNKDQVLLDLKRQIDQLNRELDNFRSRGMELNQRLGEKQEVLRRTVKALRLALSMLEQDDDVAVVLKKVD